METVPEWWTSSLAEDVHLTLCQREKTLPVFAGRSPQLGSRRCLVDWLATVCDHYNVCPTGRHLAITLLDYFMDRFVIDNDKLRLVALGCLLVAAKFEEQEIKIPKATELNKYVCHPGYNMATYLKMELMVLETFDWSIGLPTAAHFVDYFMNAAVTTADYHGSHLLGDMPPGEISKTRSYLEKYLSYFLEVSLQDHIYRDYRPSLVCAACIASSRKCLDLSPPWSIALQKVTRYCWVEVQPLVNHLLRTHQVDEKASQTSACSMSVGVASSGPVTSNVVLSTVSPNTSNLSTGSPLSPAVTATYPYASNATVTAAATGRIDLAAQSHLPTYLVSNAGWGPIVYF